MHEQCETAHCAKYASLLYKKKVKRRWHETERVGSVKERENYEWTAESHLLRPHPCHCWNTQTRNWALQTTQTQSDPSWWHHWLSSSCNITRKQTQTYLHSVHVTHFWPFTADDRHVFRFHLICSIIREPEALLKDIKDSTRDALHISLNMKFKNESKQPVLMMNVKC